MENKIKSEIKKYFKNDDIIFKNVDSGRTNINYFVNDGRKEYFIRTSISKVKDVLFGGLLEKEKKILEKLGSEGITAKLYYSFINPEYGFLVIEKIFGKEYKCFNENLEKIKVTLEKFQNVDINDFSFLNKVSLKEGYKDIILTRFKNVNIPELQDINNNLIKFLFEKDYYFQDEFCLTHNDFRLDNLIITDEKVFIIDVEGMSISDKYLDIGEYYVGGIFWDTFSDKKELDFNEFSKLMDFFGYEDKEKQLFVFILKFCSNFSWLSSHISITNNPEEGYLETLERNKKQFYDFILPLIK